MKFDNQLEWGDSELTIDEFARKLVLLFPEKEDSLTGHYKEYGELLAHIFFSEQVETPLAELLHSNTDFISIGKYCSFIEEMWKHGDDFVVNVIEVTILEGLSDNRVVWKNLAHHITPEFTAYINSDLLFNNILMTSVPKL